MESTLELVQGGVEVVDIGLVVFLVVSFKEFAADDWFQGGVGEFEFREGDLGCLCGEGG